MVRTKLFKTFFRYFFNYPTLPTCRYYQKKYLFNYIAHHRTAPNMPAKRCSRTTTAAAKKKAAAAKKRAAACRKKSVSKTRSRTRSRSSSCASSSCRQPYLKTSSGACGVVPCVDGSGNSLMGYVRATNGTCAPKKCNAGMVFNPATGGCVSQKTYEGQHLLNVKKFNDAKIAYDKARLIVQNPPKFEDEIYGRMLGGYDEVAKVQMEYAAERNAYRLQRQQDLQKQLDATAALRTERSLSRSCPSYAKPAKSGFAQFFSRGG